MQDLCDRFGQIGVDHALGRGLMGAAAVQHDLPDVVLEHLGQRFRRKSRSVELQWHAHGMDRDLSVGEGHQQLEREQSADHGFSPEHIRSPSLNAGTRSVGSIRGDFGLRLEQVAAVALVSTHLKQQDEHEQGPEVEPMDHPVGEHDQAVQDDRRGGRNQQEEAGCGDRARRSSGKSGHHHHGQQGQSISREPGPPRRLFPNGNCKSALGVPSAAPLSMPALDQTRSSDRVLAAPMAGSEKNQEELGGAMARIPLPAPGGASSARLRTLGSGAEARSRKTIGPPPWIRPVRCRRGPGDRWHVLRPRHGDRLATGWRPAGDRGGSSAACR